MRMDEKGVSPVIGVILMVAITVILAAVIASFVFGMASTAPKSAPVATLATLSEGGKVYIVHRGGDSIPLEEMRIIINDAVAYDGTASTVANLGGDENVFEAGEKINITDDLQTGTNTLVIIHIPSQKYLLETKVYV